MVQQHTSLASSFDLRECLTRCIVSSSCIMKHSVASLESCRSWRMLQRTCPGSVLRLLDPLIAPWCRSITAKPRMVLHLFTVGCLCFCCLRDCDLRSWESWLCMNPQFPASADTHPRDTGTTCDVSEMLAAGELSSVTFLQGPKCHQCRQARCSPAKQLGMQSK